MSIILIGIVVLIIGFVIAKTDPVMRRYKSIITTVGIVIILIGLSTASVVQVEPGEVGVQKLFGKVNDNILQSGLNIINPLVKVVMFDIKTENYTMSGVTDEGNKQGDDAIRVLSADGLEVIVDLTVLYKVVPSEAPGSSRRSALTTGMSWSVLSAGPKSGITPYIMTLCHCIPQKEMNSSQGYSQPLNQISKIGD